MLEAGLADSDLAGADLIVLNACTVTAGAERDIRRFLNHARAINASARIILAGCHVQAYPEVTFDVDTALGQEEKFRIHQFLDRDGTFVGEASPFSMEQAYVDVSPPGRTRVFFKIQDGCNRFCSYCIVPFARGVPRSRPLGEICRGMKTLHDRGIREVVLTGIEIASYRDPATGKDLKGLLQVLEDADTPPRIRLSSIDPLSIDDGVIELLSRSGKLTKSLHIPLQSGSDRILAKMKRPYTAGFIKRLIGKLTSAVSDIGIGLDVITGFPTEEEEDFSETYRFLGELPIYYLHVFPFSARRGTEAFSMAQQVSEAEKKDRVRRLKKLDEEKRLAFYRRYMGREFSLVPESKVYRGVYMRGYTENYIPVYFPHRKDLENTLARARIVKIEEGMPLGEIVGSEH